MLQTTTSSTTTLYPLPSPGIKYDEFLVTARTIKIGAKVMHSPSSPGAISGFVAKLWSLLENDHTYGQFIRWQESGETFAIVDIDVFSRNVLPQAFKHDKFPSFVRQLNIYGFSRVKVDPRKFKESKKWTTSFVHPTFKKAHPEWLSQIKRKQPRTSRSSQGSTSSSAGGSLSKTFSLQHPSGLLSEGPIDSELMDTLSPLSPDEPFFSMYQHSNQMDYLSPLASPRVDELEFSGAQSTPASWKDIPHSDSTYGSTSPMPTATTSDPPPILTTPVVNNTSLLEEKISRLQQINENLRQDVARLTNILSTAVFPEISRILSEQRNQANLQRSQQLVIDRLRAQMETSSGIKSEQVNDTEQEPGVQ